MDTKKIEPYLAFLNVHQLERRGVIIQTKVEEIGIESVIETAR